MSTNWHKTSIYLSHCSKVKFNHILHCHSQDANQSHLRSDNRIWVLRAETSKTFRKWRGKTATKTSASLSWFIAWLKCSNHKCCIAVSNLRFWIDFSPSLIIVSLNDSVIVWGNHWPTIPCSCCQALANTSWPHFASPAVIPVTSISILSMLLCSPANWYNKNSERISRWCLGWMGSSSSTREADISSKESSTQPH